MSVAAFVSPGPMMWSTAAAVHAWSSIDVSAPSFLHPAGPTAAATTSIFWSVIAAMAVIVVPVFILTPLVAWRYRRDGKRSFKPTWDRAPLLEVVIWGVPVLIVAGLSVLAWQATHQLDPYRRITDRAPLEIQVVGLDWKWLFIYPAQRIATVDALVIPAGRPVHFRLTSATVMQSFMIPRLGGQIYAMAGMTTQLNLIATKNAVLTGENTQFNGTGFAHQRFPVLAVSDQAFDRFLARAAASARTLDRHQFRALARPSIASNPVIYARVAPDLFGAVVRLDPDLLGANR